MTVEGFLGIGLQVLFALVSAFFIFVWLLMARRVVLHRPRFSVAVAATASGLGMLYFWDKLAPLLALLWVAFIVWLMASMFRRVIAPLPESGADGSDPSWPESPRLPPAD